MFNNIKKAFDQYRGLSKSIYVIFFARIVTNMGAFIWPMITFIMSDKMGLTSSQIAVFIAVAGIVMVPSSYIGGKLADKYSKKKIIIIFDTVSVLLFISCAFMEPGYPMIITFAVAGIFANMEWPAFEALFIEASKPNERERVFSLSYLGMNLGLVAGAMIGGFLYENHLSLAFVLDGLTTFTSTVLIVLFVKSLDVDTLDEEEKNEYEDSEEDHISTLEILKKRKSVLLMVLVFSMSALVYQQWGFALPLYLASIYGASGAKLYGAITSFNGFVVIAFTPILTAALVRFKELPKVMIGIALFSLSFLMILNEPLRIVYFIMIFVFTIGEVINTIGSSPFVSRRIPASHRGRVSSYISIGYGVGGLGGQVIAGFVIEAFGFDVWFVILAVVGILAVTLVSYTYKTDKAKFPKLYIEGDSK